MSALTTSDGFEFETVREGGTIRCVCRRGGLESSVTVECGPSLSPDSVQTEQLELIARNAWLAGARLARRRHRRDEDYQ